MATQTGSIDLRGVKQSYEGVEVGGRNLLINSSKYTESSPYSLTTTAKDGYKYLDLYTNIQVKTGEVYVVQAETDGTWSATHGGSSGGSTDTVSLWLVGSTDKVDNAAHIYCSITGANPMYLGNGKWKWTVESAWNGYYVKIRINNYNTDGTTSVTHTYWNFKLEKGNKPTAWTPAPEDVQDGIDTAQDTADTARDEASLAQSTATSAQNDAASAQMAADNAQDTADNALINAGVASENATAAQNTANEAMNGISNIEQIVGASSWVTSHGIYNKSTDTTVDIAKEYFTVSATAVSNPTGNPHNGLYYELSNNVYVLTSDNVVVSGKTYYTLSANLVASPSGNPSSNGYYERRLNESVEEYLSTHVLMKSDGLFVTDGSTSQVQINSTGVSILNGEKTIASYGSVAQIGAADEFHILIGGEENEIGFYQGENTKLAYLNGNELYVQNSLSFGNAPYNTFTFYQRSNGHFTLKLVD